MGLITKEIEITINKQAKYYESKGYFVEYYWYRSDRKYPVKNQKLIVNVFDLPLGSGNKVKVMCDNKECGLIKEIAWSTYLGSIENTDGNYYCRKCGDEKYKFRRRISQKRLEKGLTFERWCLENNLEHLLLRWDNDLNELFPNQVMFSSSKKFYFKCGNGIKEHESSLFPISTITKKANMAQCRICNSVGFIYPESFYYWSDLNKINPYDVTKMNGNKYFWKCNNLVHEDFKRTVGSSVRSDFRCPECMHSKNESMFNKKVREYLETLGYKIFHEDKCSLRPRNPLIHKKTKSKFLRYDDEIVISDDIRIFIEINGHQHYEITGFAIKDAKLNGTTPEYEFEYQQAKDEYKRQYVLDQGYQFLEIPYWFDNKNEDWKHAIDDAINYCLSLE